jgi:predicted nucleic acid-binding protein
MEAAFWDSSALVPICVTRQASAAVLSLLERYDPVVWWGTSVEMCGAFARLLKIGDLTANGHVQALVRLDRLRRSWDEIAPSERLRDRAESLVERFGMKGADSLQLAAAWVWSSGRPRNRPFISADVQLLAAAVQLGFNSIEA